jgi:GNAT superfamily N-acetyltransferase
MITYQQEPLCKFIPDVNYLVDLDWKEVGRPEAGYHLEPDWDLYQILESSGSLKVFTARSDGKLIGYFTVVISPSLHSKGNFVVSNDAIFLDPNYRSGLVGVKLFQFVEKCIQEDGFNQLQITFTNKFDISNLLARLGYDKVETKFEKRLT